MLLETIQKAITQSTTLCLIFIDTDWHVLETAQEI